MDSERTSLIVIGILAIAFVIGISERLQQPFPVMGTSTPGGMIAGVIGGILSLALFAGAVFSPDASRKERLRSMVIWSAILTIAVIAVTLYGGTPKIE
ncbi:hypothetical protein MCEMSEM23_00774 [Rhabdaerophilaceae bacterium]